MSLYEFKVMLFGLCNSPATFQRLIETVLTGLIPQSCIDDMLATGKTFSEHLANPRAASVRATASCESENDAPPINLELF